jgi:sulfatase modifying factor 1
MIRGAAPQSVSPSPVAEPALDIVWIPGGTFRMGSERHYPDEAPTHRVSVDGFWIDRTPVTNRQFREFVEATGYRTVAEIASRSLVFVQPKKPVDPREGIQWWEYRCGASWQHPLGHNSSIHGYDDHPVVHVAYQDAEAYAAWAGESLPTEAEWEFAARGGLEGAEFAWGNVFLPNGRYMANTWQGAFPHQNLRHGDERTSRVTAFPPNGYALYDMIGNVWEWTADWYAPKHLESTPSGLARNKVVKGGSHLCAPNYSRRYRPAARQGQAIDTPTSDIGFRCVVRTP